MSITKEISLPIFKLALPLIIIQLCQASLGLMNTIIAGRYNYLDLAAVGLGSNIWAPIFIFCTGILYVLVPKFSFLKQQKAKEQTTELFHQAKIMAMLLAFLGFLLTQLVAFLCPYFISNTEIIPITQSYLYFVAFGIPGLVFMVMYRFISEGNSELSPIIITCIMMLVCDALLSALFVYGIGFIPEMGGAGAGLATAISAYIGCFLMRYLVIQYNKEIAINKTKQLFPWRESFNLLKQGLPIGMTLVLQILALATLAFFTAKLGTKAIAAHQIVINLAMVIIMIPVAISSATTIRIAHFSAMGNRRGKQYTSLIVVAFTCIYGFIMAMLLILFSDKLMTLFTQEQAVLDITSTLVVYVAFFLFFDALQTVAAGVLRGVQKFIQPLLVILLSYWMLIIPLSYFVVVSGWLNFIPSVKMIWLILALGIVFAALVMMFLSFRSVFEYQKG